jgi:ribose transport system permease protein
LNRSVQGMQSTATATSQASDIPAQHVPSIDAATSTQHDPTSQPSSPTVNSRQHNARLSLPAFAGSRRITTLGTLVLVFLIECLVFGSINSRFASVANAQTVGYEVSFNVILAVGTTAAMISNTLDISFAAIAGLSGVLVAVLATHAGVPLIAAIIIALVVSILVGLANGIVSVFVGVPPFIVTLAMLFIAYGVQLEVTSGNVIPVSGTLFHKIAAGYVGPIPLPVIYALVVAFAGGYWLRRTVSGAHVCEIGSNEEASYVFGVRVSWVRMAVLMVQSGLAGIVGILFTAELSSATPSLGSTRLLTVIAAVVLGGTSLFGGEGSIIGSVIGVLFIGTLQDGLVLIGVNPDLEYLVTGLFLMLAVIAQFLSRRNDHVS